MSRSITLRLKQASVRLSGELNRRLCSVDPYKRAKVDAGVEALKIALLAGKELGTLWQKAEVSDGEGELADYDTFSQIKYFLFDEIEFHLRFVRRDECWQIFEIYFEPDEGDGFSDAPFVEIEVVSSLVAYEFHRKKTGKIRSFASEVEECSYEEWIYGAVQDDGFYIVYYGHSQLHESGGTGAVGRSPGWRATILEEPFERFGAYNCVGMAFTLRGNKEEPAIRWLPISLFLNTNLSKARQQWALDEQIVMGRRNIRSTVDGMATLS